MHTQNPYNVSNQNSAHAHVPDMPSMLSKLSTARIIPLALIALAVVPYIFNVTGYFLSDDFVLLDWTHVHSLSAIPSFFDPNTFWFYRPLLKVYYWAGQSLFGLNALPFHLFSLLIHGLNGWLLYRLMLAQKASSGVALAGAAVFLLIPHHAETVSWIAATGDLIAVGCILSALIFAWRYMEQGSIIALAGTILLFALGLFTRETTIVLPLLFVVDVFIFSSAQLREQPKTMLTRLLLTLAGYGVVLAIYGLIQIVGHTGSALDRGGLAFHTLDVDSILLGIMSYVHGLLPGGNLIADLPLEVLKVVVWLELVILLAIAVMLWKAKQKLVLFGLAWMLLTPLVFVPFSGPTDRYFYLRSVGYAIFISAALYVLLMAVAKWRANLSPRFAGVAFATLAALLVLVQLPGLWSYERDWRFAGRTSNNVFTTTKQAAPDPHDYAIFFYVNLPPDLNGVPAFGNGIQQAIQLVYSNTTLAASITTCDYLQQNDLPRYSYFFRFDNDNVTQFTDKVDCAK